MIPGARGCTPQTCAFRDLHKVMIAAGAARVFGLSTQDPAYQHEAAERLHLPFPLLSDEKLALTKALRLPTMQVAGHDADQAPGAGDRRRHDHARSSIRCSRRTGTRATCSPGSSRTGARERVACVAADDGGARHLKRGMRMPDIALPTTAGREVNFARLRGAAIVYCYPWTGTAGPAQSAGLGRHSRRPRLDAAGGRVPRSLCRLPAGRCRRVRPLHAAERLPAGTGAAPRSAVRDRERRALRAAARAVAADLRDRRRDLPEAPHAGGAGTAASSASTIPSHRPPRMRARCAPGSA